MAGFAALLLFLGASLHAADTNTNTPGWLAQPMSLGDAIRIALLQNRAILKGQSDLQAAYGIVVQTRAIAWPRVRGSGNYDHNEGVEQFPFPSVHPITYPKDEWSGSIRIVQNIYEGGRIRSALRTAKLTQEQALLQYQAVVADTLLAVRTAYYDVLLAAQQIIVQEASVKLLTEQLDNTTHRFNVGTVPRFDVLRAEVEVANARPKLIHARNQYRIAKTELATDLGYNIPATIWEDIPLNLTGALDAEPYNIELPAALAQAAAQRPELGALRKTIGLRKEDIVVAKSGYLPTMDVFAGYGARSSSYDFPGHDSFYKDISGAIAGVELTWDIFDGHLTRGKVIQAKALYDRAQLDLDDNARKIELEVRTAYSSFLEAREVLESQKKVLEQAEEALRLAGARYEAGTGTQLDVLNAQTSLTDARSTQVQALHDYDVARARLERAIGQDAPQQMADRGTKKEK